MNTAEFFGRFSSPVRGALFFGSLTVMVLALYYWIINPLVHLYGIGKSLTNEEAAQQIGRFFPEVGDKLLNTLQLRALTRQQSDLLEASINQRSKQLLIVRFADAIQINQNRRFIKYAIIPAFIIGGLLLLYPAFLTSTSKSHHQLRSGICRRSAVSVSITQQKSQSIPERRLYVGVETERKYAAAGCLSGFEKYTRLN
jgi:hypothetical protein